MGHTLQILEMIGGFVTGEMPLFMLVLHMNSRIVRLETQISYLTEAVKK